MTERPAFSIREADFQNKCKVVVESGEINTEASVNERPAGGQQYEKQTFKTPTVVVRRQSGEINK